jgi:hypothetical protein
MKAATRSQMPTICQQDWFSETVRRTTEIDPKGHLDRSYVLVRGECSGACKHVVKTPRKHYITNLCYFDQRK